MTYNVYFGSSVEPVLGVENLLEVPAAVTTVYNTFVASDFPGRAPAIATAIKAHQPHLIGLQEMSLIRHQSPGDRIAGGSVPVPDPLYKSITNYYDTSHNLKFGETLAGRE